MARASTTTLLSIDQWAEQMGVSPWEINQFGKGFPSDLGLQCEHVFFQYSWQQDFLCREEVAFCIGRAEQLVAQQLGYWPAPRYTVGEELQYPRNYRRAVFGYGGTARNDWKALKTNYGKIVAPGIHVFTLIGTANVTLHDYDLDTLNETFTASIATTVTDPTQMSVAFQASDRFGAQPVDDSWLIRPVKITISAGTATITGHSSLLSPPILQNVQNPDPAGLDVTVAANYVTAIEVYSDTIDGTFVPGAGNTANQGVAEWEGDITVPPGSVQTLPIALNARNAETGMIAPDWLLWGMVNPQGMGQIPPQAREPDRVVVNYLSGIPYVNGRMEFKMADVVSKLATGMIAAGRAGCERSNRIIDYWRQLPSYGQYQRPMTQKELDQMPWEPTRGGLYAWEQIKNIRLVGSSRI